MAKICERIRELRQERGENQKDLADALGITASAISGYELGTRTPDYLSIAKMAYHFNVTTDYLIGASDTKRLENDNINKRLGLSDKAIDILAEIHKSNPGNSITRTVNALIEDGSVLWEIGRLLYYELDTKDQEVYEYEDGSNALMTFPLVYRYKSDSEVTGRTWPVDPDIMSEVITNETWREVALLKIQDRLNKLYEEVIKECPVKEEPTEPEP